MKKIRFLLLLCTIFSPTFSQIDIALKDYIISKENDTIYGLVDESTGSMKVGIEVDNEKKYYKPYDLLGIKKGLRVYKVKVVNDMHFLFRMVINDQVSLFESGNILTNPNSAYLIEKNDSLIRVSDDNKFNKIASKIFSDYSDLSKAILNNCFNYYDLPEIVNLYNSWLKGEINLIDKELIDNSYKNFSKGYIILSNYSDTLYGYIQHLDFEKITKFKNKDGISTSYTDDKIEGYLVNKRFYRKIHLNRDKILWENIYGTVKLYSEFKNGAGGVNPSTGLVYTGGDYINLYICKGETNNAIKVKEKNLLLFFSANTILYSKITERYYTLDDIETIIYIFNNAK